MGVMIGSALSSLMIERLGSLRLMAFSYAAMAAAVASLGVNSWGSVSCQSSATVSRLV
jgi:hypothetical protein